jgi:hypothetical protein
MVQTGYQDLRGHLKLIRRHSEALSDLIIDHYMP